jgi:carbonic anhydrase/acetyltransferase-like protein (isoleucine patch superfamily)
MIYKKSWKYIIIKDNYLRIKSLKDFSDVKKGKIGGYIGGYHNLSQKGNCWIYDGAVVKGRAKVSENATIHNYAVVRDFAQISGNARVTEGTTVAGHAIVSDNVTISNFAIVSDNAKVSGNAQVLDYVQVAGNAIVTGNDIVTGNTIISKEGR